MEHGEPSEPVNVGQGSKWYAVFVCVFASVGGLSFGYDQGATGGVLVMRSFLNHFCVGHDGNTYDQCTASSLDVPHNWTNFTTTYNVLYFVGCMVGSLLGGLAADKLGRRTAIFTAGLFYFAGSCLLAFTTQSNHAMALIARVIQGLGVGNASFSAPLFGVEMAPLELRGMLSGFLSMAISTGTLLAGLIGYGLQHFDHGWRTTVALGMITPLILMLGAFFLPESPRWIYQHKGRHAAEATLAKLRKTTDVGEELKAIGDMLDELGSSEEASWKDVFDATVRRRIGIAMVLAALQQMTGVTIVFAYGAQIFKDVLEDGIRTLLIFQAITFVSSITAMYWVDRAGRRTLLLLGGLGMVLGHFVTGLSFSVGCHTASNDFGCGKGAGWIMVVSTAFFMFSFGLSWGPICWIYPAEIFPLKVRARAVSVSTFANWAMAAVMIEAPKLFPTLHVNGVFFLVAFLCLCGCVFVYYMCPETKGVGLEDIELLFNVNKTHLDAHAIETPADDKL
ncbi:hypothetical protein LEN26_001429 [Aphanomyces euteiches]|nr:hypothetical protein AeMF1_002276 [Aphanomyces euteiches]KAH9161416.1 hypothetical protein LEN26_001429 [Aphanomyces euteiches]KAH9190969.1 hypothetical protein AeNC1_007042 [Aphanomyces euteiches]